MSFNITNNRGFAITFNTMTVSVQFGSPNYCDNYDNKPWPAYVENFSQLNCENAEVALWDSKGEWVTRQCWKEVFNKELNDDVVGYVTANELIRVLAWAATQ